MRTKRPLREPVRDAPGPKQKNYITPAGLQRLKDEHHFLMSRERPAVTQVVSWAAGNGDRSENADYLYGKRRLRQIDSRIRFLTKRIDAAEVVDPAAPRPGAAGARVFFGATVTFEDAAGQSHTVSIVGLDEVDLDRRYISWMSPLARALMKSAPGDRVTVHAPTRTEQIEVLDLEYAPIPMEPFREPAGAESAGRTDAPKASPLTDTSGKAKARNDPESPTTRPDADAFPRGLSGPALRALHHAGIRTMEDLAGRTEREVARLHGMGPKGVRELKASLAAQGRRFRDAG
jgi:transcription elongation factor GreB